MVKTVDKHKAASIPPQDSRADEQTRSAINRACESVANRGRTEKKGGKRKEGLRPLPQFLLVLFARSSLTELVFVISTPATLGTRGSPAAPFREKPGPAGGRPTG